MSVCMMIYKIKLSPPEVRVPVNNNMFHPTVRTLHWTCSKAVSALSKRWERKRAKEEKQLESVTLKIHIVWK